MDVHGCVRAALEVCRSVLADRRLQVTVELGASHPTVWGEAARLQQVFWNLLQNAAKFTPPGGVVMVRSRNRDDDGIIIEVTDTGDGIAPEVLPKLFDPFEQGGAEVARRHGELGLGLAISQAIVQAHGGRLRPASAGPGQGATFTVELSAWSQPDVALPEPTAER